MSNKIDERIVEMSFDNKQFEKGIGKSQKSLNDFKKSLDFKDQEKSLNDFSSSFTKMGAVTFSIINNLTNKILDFGIALTKSLALDPIMAGMDDYNTKLTTMQTITSATGKSIAEVEVYFDKLDDYADKTIYNLTDMTSSLSKFVNAGVDLDRATPAIIGISNAVALAGQDANAASIAMYNLSQSIAGGFLTTMDYRSLNLANVATIEWKDNMINAAVAMGSLTKVGNAYQTAEGGAYSATQLFTEGLKDQWATTEVMLKVFGEYGDTTTDIGKKAQAAAQDVKSFSMMMETLQASVGTGWTRSFEAIIGDLEESKQLWTAITNAISEFIDRVSDARNEMLEFWKANGGRDAFLAGLRNAALAILKVMLAVSMAFDQIFPPKTYEQIINIFKAFEEFTKLLIIGDDAADQIRRTFAGLFSVIDIFIQVISFVGNVLGQIIGEIFPGFSGGLLDITANIGDVLVAIRNLIVNSGFFQKLLEKTGPLIHKIVGFIKDAGYALIGLIAGIQNGSISFGAFGSTLKQIFDGIKLFISNLLQGKSIIDSFSNAFSNISLKTSEAKDGISNFGSIFSDNIKSIEAFINVIKDKLAPVFDWLKTHLGSISMQHIVALAAGVALLLLAKKLLSVFNPLTAIADAFQNVLEKVSKAIQAFTLKTKAEAIFTIAKAIALLAAALVVLSFIPLASLIKALAAVAISLALLIATLKLLDGLKNPAKIGADLFLLSAGLLVMALVAEKFDGITWGGLLKAGVAIAAVMGVVVGFSKLMGQTAIVSTGLGTLAKGLLTMAAAIKIISMIDTESLLKGIGAISALLAIITVFSKIMGNSDLAKSTAGLTGLGIGLITITGALAILGNLPFETLAQGSIALTGLLWVLSMFVLVTSGNDLAISGKALIGLGVGLIAMAGALAILGSLSFETLAQGAITLTSLMTAIAMFVLITNGSDLAISGKALIGLGVGLIAMAGALAILGSIDFASLLKGGAAILGLMAAIAIFVNVTNGKDLGVTAGAMIAFAGGIAILAAVMAILSMLDTSSLLAAAVAISGVIIAIGAFAKLTNLGNLLKSAVGLLAFAVALAALSIPIQMIAAIPWEQLLATAAVVLAAVGAFVLVALAMKVLQTAGASAAGALTGVLAVGAVIVVIAAILVLLGALMMIPEVQQLINDGGEFLYSIGAALGKFVGGIVGGIGEGVTRALPAMGENISAFGEAIKPFFESIAGIDSASIDAVRNLAETLLILGAASIAEGLSSWFSGKSSLTSFAEELDAFADPFISFVNKMTAGNISLEAVSVASAAAKVMSALASGLPNSGGWAGAIMGENNISTFATELDAFADPFISFVNKMTAGNIDVNAVQTAATAAQIMSTLAENLPNSGGMLADFVGDNSLHSFALQLSRFADPFIEFITKMNTVEVNQKNVKTAVHAAEMMSALAENLPNSGGMLAEFTGDNTLSSFATQLELFADPFVSFANKLGTITVESSHVNTAKNAAKMITELATNLPNSGGVASWFSGDNTLGKFAEELEKFGPKFITFVNGFSTIKKDAVTPGLEALKSLVEALKVNGTKAMESLGKGFENNKSASLKKIKKVLDGVVDGIKDYQKKFIGAGEYAIQGFNKGMDNEKSSVKKKAKEIAETVLLTIDDTLGIASPAKELIEKGKYALQGFIQGIMSKKDELIGTIDGLGGSVMDSFGDMGSSSFTKGLEDLIASLETGFGDAGLLSGDSFSAGLSNSNFTNGLDSMGKKAKTSVEKVKTEFEKFKEWLEEEKFYNRIDTAGEIVEWEKQQKIYKENSEERKEIDRQLYTLRKRLIDETYQKELDYIEELKFYNKITLAEELAMYKELQEKYEEGTEHRKKLDREVFTLEKALLEESKKAIEEKYQMEMKYIEEKNYYGQLSLEEELAAYKLIRDEYEEGSEQHMALSREIWALEKKIYESQLQYIKDVAAAQEDADNKRIAAQKKYDDAVSKANSTASKNTASAQKKHDTTVANAQKDAAKKTEDAQKKYSEKITKISEDEAKKRVDIEQKAADDIEKIHEQLLKDVEAAEKRYTDAVKSRADTIYGYFGLFDKVGEKQSFTPEELLENLAGQNAELEDWRSSLEMLETRGVSKELLEELQALGVSSNGQLKALLAMTDEQLTEFQALFQRKHHIADSRALDELKDYREDVNAEIKELYAQADRDAAARIAKLNQELAELHAEIAKSMAEAEADLQESLNDINATLQEKLSEAESEFAETTAEIQKELEESLAEAKKELDESMDEINKDLAEKLKTLEESFIKTMETIHEKSAEEYEALNKELKETLETMNANATEELAKMEATVTEKTESAANNMTENIQTGVDDSTAALTSLNNNVNSIFSGFEQSLYNVGAQGAQGLANGLLSGQYSVQSAGQSLGNAALNAAMAALQVHSPSKAMFKVGMYADQGLANGLYHYANLVTTAGFQIGEDSLNALSKSLSQMSDMSFDDMETSPIITPVLDLSQIEAGLGTLDSLFGSKQAYKIAAETKSSAIRETNQNGSNSSESSVIIENRFDLSGMIVRSETDIDDLAKQLYRRQEQALRSRGGRSLSNKLR